MQLSNNFKLVNALGKDDIRPEMSKSMKVYGLRWLTRVCQVVWKAGQWPSTKAMANQCGHTYPQERRQEEMH